jgi:hypothetical protein
VAWDAAPESEAASASAYIFPCTASASALVWAMLLVLA